LIHLVDYKCAKNLIEQHFAYNGGPA